MALVLQPAPLAAFPWPRLPVELTLTAAEVHVVCASVDVSGQRLRDLTARLSPDELDRAERFHFARDRDRFIARRGLLREILGVQTHIAPDSLVFFTGPFGKPALVPPSKGRTLHFSLAHSNDIAVFAISREAPVGIDVELVRELSDLYGMVSTVFSSREKGLWRSLPESQRLQAFFDAWTRKEAFLKGTGQGLQKPPREIEVPLCCFESGRELHVFDGGRHVPHWSLRSLSAGDFALALALKRPPTRVCCWEWPSEPQPHRFPCGH